MVKVYYKNSAGSVIDLAGKNYKMHKLTDLLSYRWNYSNNEFINKIEAFSMEYAEKNITVSIMARDRKEYESVLKAIGDTFEYDVKTLSPGKLYVNNYYLSCYILSAEQSRFDWHKNKTDKTYGIIAESGQWIKETEYNLSQLSQIEDETDLSLQSAHIFKYPINILNPPLFTGRANVVRNKIMPDEIGEIVIGTVYMTAGVAYQAAASKKNVVFSVQKPDGTMIEVTNRYIPEDTGIHTIIAKVDDLQEFYVVVNEVGQSYEGFPSNDYKIRAVKDGEVVTEKVASGTDMYMHGAIDSIESDYYVEYEITDYPCASALDYPYDFEYDLGAARITKYVNNTSITGADFILLIYGPCSNPAVYINGHLYQVNVTLYTGEYLEINSVTKRINKIKASGERVNCFSLRNKESYIFEKIRPGMQTVIRDGVFGIKLTLLEERSEPEWWI